MNVCKSRTTWEPRPAAIEPESQWKHLRQPLCNSLITLGAVGCIVSDFLVDQLSKLN